MNSFYGSDAEEDRPDKLLDAQRPPNRQHQNRQLDIRQWLRIYERDDQTRGG